MNIICAKPETGVLVPIPQYPLYTATMALMNAKVVPYYLEEQSGWSTDVPGIHEALKKAREEGIDVRAVVVINPGNPTGGSLSPENVKSVIELAAEEKLVVLADEVYQTNIFEGEFYSFKKGLRELQKGDKGKDGRFDNVELASMHSISKGMVGECGHRGGYYEMVGFDEEVSCSTFHQAQDNKTLTFDSGRCTNLQIRQHHALPTRHRPMPSRAHGQPAKGGRAFLRAIQGRVRRNLQRPPHPCDGFVQGLPRDGRCRMPVPTG
jgi:aspartate/methionine/tyrosine aminotransferase